MAIMILIQPNNAKMKASLTLVLRDIVWTSLALIIRLMVNVSKKIAPPIHLRLVPVPLSAKPLAAEIVNNVVPIIVLPALKTTQVLTLRQQNAATNVTTAIPLVLPVHLLLIPEPLVLKTNVVSLVKNVRPPVLQVA